MSELARTNIKVIKENTLHNVLISIDEPVLEKYETGQNFAAYVRVDPLFSITEPIRGETRDESLELAFSFIEKLLVSETIYSLDGRNMKIAELIKDLKSFANL